MSNPHEMGPAAFVEPLTMLKPNGTRYERLPHVEAQLRWVVGLVESLLILEVPDLYSECIVYLIRRGKSFGEELYARLVEELMARLERQARWLVRHLGEDAIQDICSDVRLETLKLILPAKLDEGADFFEVVFAPGVQARTCDAKRRYQRSLTGGRREQDDIVEADEESDDLDRLKRLEDGRPNPEAEAIVSSNQALCRGALEKVRGKFDPEYVEAALLFHCEDVPMFSKDPEKDSIARRQEVSKSTVQYRIDTVMKALRNLLMGEGDEN
ncbi:MAG TPA: hypothetical protein VGK48_05760 [Terriglobia bacterium]|jgi:hypothetical protein